MINGLWSVRFESKLGATEGGIIIFRCGEVFGGDAGHFYSGRYEVDRGIVNGEVMIKSYTCTDASNLFFSHLCRSRLIFDGKIQQPKMELVIRAMDAPDSVITARCRKVANLRT